MTVSTDKGADKRGRTIPRWVLFGALLIALIQPVLHIWLAYLPPEGSAPTGLVVSDTVVFRHCMRMFETGFESSHATCQSPWGMQDIRYYSSPLHWLYGVLGPIGRIAHIPELQFLGLINAAGMFAYLIAAFCFLRAAVPQQARLAWLLFVFVTGPGGVAYVLTGIFGLHSHPNFDLLFWRFAYYDLMEGANSWPMLHMARLYYTLPLATGLGAFALLIRACKGGAPAYVMPVMAVAMLAASFINLRVGPMFGVVAILYLACQHELPGRTRLRYGVYYIVPIGAGLFAAWLMLRTRESYMENAFAMTSITMWWIPFLYAAVFHLALGAVPLLRTVRALPRVYRGFACAAIGYLFVLTAVIAFYHLYWGNWLYGGDVRAARILSDWALIGAAGGFVAGIAAGTQSDDTTTARYGWIALWLLLFLALAPSAFGQGWFMRFAPQRFMVLLGLPLSVMAALGIETLKTRRPRLARTATITLVVCGVTSIGMSWFFVQGPAGWKQGEGPYAWLRLGLMSEADAELLARIDEGVVLAPAERQPFFGDIASLKPGVRTVFGTGTLDLSTQLSLDMRREVEIFFDVHALDADRRAFVEKWCVDYVYCPDTAPVAEDVMAQLRNTPWLNAESEAGQAVLFSVQR